MFIMFHLCNHRQEESSLFKSMHVVAVLVVVLVIVVVVAFGGFSDRKRIQKYN